MDNDFAELVKQQFRFLIEQYGFSVVDEDKNPRIFGGRLVQFRSETTVVIVTDDQGSVTVDVGPVSEPRIAQYDLINIVSFLAPAEKMSSQINPPELARQPEKRIRYQVEKFASLLKQYCDPFLRGDFSRWIDVGRFIVECSRANYKAITGRELSEGALERYVNAKMNTSKPPDV